MKAVNEQKITKIEIQIYSRVERYYLLLYGWDAWFVQVFFYRIKHVFIIYVNSLKIHNGFA